MKEFKTFFVYEEVSFIWLSSDSAQRNLRTLKVKNDLEQKRSVEDFHESSRVDETSSEAKNDDISISNEETAVNSETLGNNSNERNTGSISYFLQIMTEDEKILLHAKTEEKQKAQILCAKRSLMTNLLCCLLFIVGHIMVVLLPTDVRIYISVIIFTTVKGAMPILTTISNFGTVQSVIFQYGQYFQNLFSSR